MATSGLKKKIGVGRHASSIKRNRQNEKKKAANRHAISRMRTAVKKVRLELNDESLNKVIPIIAKVTQKGMIHKNKASRLISRLCKAVNNTKSA